MKNWKTVLVTAVIALLVVALGLMGKRVFVSQRIRDTKTRIKQYEVIAKEQRLITEILQLKHDAAVIQSKFQSAQPQSPPPGTITGMEYIPMDKIPTDAKVSDGLGAPPKQFVQAAVVVFFSKTTTARL